MNEYNGHTEVERDCLQAFKEIAFAIDKVFKKHGVSNPVVQEVTDGLLKDSMGTTDEPTD